MLKFFLGHARHTEHQPVYGPASHISVFFVYTNQIHFINRFVIDISNSSCISDIGLTYAYGYIYEVDSKSKSISHSNSMATKKKIIYLFHRKR